MKRTASFLSKPLDSIFLCRPMVLVPVWGFSLFGYFAGRNGKISTLHTFWQATDINVFLWMLVFSCSVGCVYVLNQIADSEVDKKNGGLPLIAGGVVSIKQAIFTALFAALASLILPAVFGRGTIAFLSLLSIALGAVYSFKPTYFSGRPYFDFLTNGVGFGIIAFGAGWISAGRSLVEPLFFLKALPYFLLMCAGSISSTIPDIGGDALGGKRTTAVVLGERKAHVLSFVLLIAAAIFAAGNKDIVAGFCAIAGLPFYFLYRVSPKRIFAEAAYKAGGALSMVAAALIMPLFLLCGIAVFISTRMYFRWRHGVTYPSLTSARVLPASSEAKDT
jgi:4-hydroxybenzoate polyprenyltransferase